ncbi:putative bifunctional diguanylate cyclase/phosphodiesterase [Pseudohaliea rubra]|uniref:Diguanylate cyclase/phosphodiesterase (GGDEF & EAL domain protein) with PAS/PAC sensor(S) n=1 Tax=Pseudohaliea rubra DSM 19751 TaxID=1265313 RepID=A0A095X1E2_9GAMM|nr:EAL domain-containing protein [Pseudohaliea rubra]KGE04679.1 diguanylate cyclase/phosphodiesterase (GGDEF & EAL domain protein) with PAS/PAC sensor(s) [Pseudohaliea rubra DSM 19751]
MRLTDTDGGTETRPSAAADKTGLAHYVHAERLALHYQFLRQSLAAVLLNSVVLCWLLWGVRDAGVLLGWLLATLLTTVYRLLAARGFARASARARTHRRWYRHAIAGSVLSGLVWGAGGFLLFTAENSYSLSLLAFIIAGMCAGAVVSLAAFIEASLPFLALCILPFAARLFAEGSMEAVQLGIIALLYLGFMAMVTRRVHDTLTRGFEMSHLRQRAEATVERQALYDDLTGLPNRRLLSDRLRQARARALRRGNRAAVLFLDLDNFKRINDSLGHSTGDAVLQAIAGRLREALRETDTASRLGGDEFVVLLTELNGSVDEVIQDTHNTAERIRVSIAEPITVKGTQLHLSSSIGVSLFPSDSNDIEDLLRHADTAMYQAKDGGRNAVRFFVPEMQAAIEARLILEQQLRYALERNELELHLQPQFDARGAVFGAEALLRWRRDGDWIPPSEFIPVAEESGLIYPLGDWVVDEACRLLADLCKLPGCASLVLAVNVSTRQFTRVGFADTVIATLERHRIPTGQLELEVTESLFINELGTTQDCMEQLHAAGLRFTIDDFGTGYSSLRYLQTLAVDSLKIDKSFVRGVIENHSDASIVRATLSMAQALKLTVLAEGVESEDIREFLVACGCRRFQGYLFGRPVPASAFRQQLLSSGVSPPP